MHIIYSTSPNKICDAVVSVVGMQTVHAFAYSFFFIHSFHSHFLSLLFIQPLVFSKQQQQHQLPSNTNRTDDAALRSGGTPTIMALKTTTAAASTTRIKQQQTVYATDSTLS